MGIKIYVKEMLDMVSTQDERFFKRKLLQSFHSIQLISGCGNILVW